MLCGLSIVVLEPFMAAGLSRWGLADQDPTIRLGARLIMSWIAAITIVVIRQRPARGMRSNGLHIVFWSGSSVRCIGSLPMSRLTIAIGEIITKKTIPSTSGVMIRLASRPKRIQPR